MLPHVAARVFNTPLLLHRASLDALVATLAPRLGVLPPDALASAAAAPSRSAAVPSDALAIIPIHGTLVRRTGGFDALCGLTSYEAIETALHAALEDPRVRGIVLDVDSPGGEAAGLFDLADRIAAARTTKPIWAVANDSAFSAAYALAASASHVTLTRTAGVGSIGVIALHVDQSARDAREGYRYTAITAGAHKADGSPHAPLSDAAHTALQTEVDRLHGLFIDTVARHRAMSPDAIRATQARLFFGEDALAAGLADRLGTLTDACTALRAELAATPASPLLSSSRPKAVMDPTTTPALPPSVIPTAAHTDALVIAELCLLAGQPQRTAEFLAQGATLDAVRQNLLAARAASPEIASRHTSTPTSAASLEDNPVVRAAKARAAAAGVR